MEKINEKSSLWVEKFRPQTLRDLIVPTRLRDLFSDFVIKGEIPNLLLSGTAGLGKTSFAKALVNDLDSDYLYINGSLERSIDVIRYKVTQFASTMAFGSGKKIVIIDESEKLGVDASDALKCVLEEFESNCRFIFATNNEYKIITPLKSRLKEISFNYSESESNEIKPLYYKRILEIVTLEGKNPSPEDKKLLGQYVIAKFPDFRKMIGDLEFFYQMYGKLTPDILLNRSEAVFDKLITAMKGKDFAVLRQVCTEIESTSFYQQFYNNISELLEPKCIPDIILTLGRYAYQHCMTINPEINLVACVTEMKAQAVWKVK